MPVQLVALNEGASIVLDKPILLLGRHPDCDIQINSRKISRRHCCIAQVSNYLVVRDLGSTNGIRINGVRVMEGKLKEGDELTVGNQRYRLQVDAAARRPRQQTLHPSDDFESCEVPIPLKEPASATRKPVDGNAEPISVPKALPVVPGNAISESPQPPPRIVPENLDLALGNDEAVPPM